MTTQVESKDPGEPGGGIEHSPRALEAFLARAREGHTLEFWTHLDYVLDHWLYQIARGDDRPAWVIKDLAELYWPGREFQLLEGAPKAEVWWQKDSLRFLDEFADAATGESLEDLLRTDDPERFLATQPRRTPEFWEKLGRVLDYWLFVEADIRWGVDVWRAMCELWWPGRTFELDEEVAAELADDLEAELAKNDDHASDKEVVKGMADLFYLCNLVDAETGESAIDLLDRDHTADRPHGDR
jgi:hypothetical protein